MLDQATALHKCGRLDEAETLYRSIIAQNPNQPDALALLGVLLGNKHLNEEAIGNLERAIELDPETPLFRFYLGKILSEMKDYSKAAERFREAVARNADFGEAWLYLSDMSIKTKDYSGAAHAAQKALHITPDHVPGLIAYGLALDFLDREEEALLCYQRITEIKPDFVQGWDILGTTYGSLNRLDEAETTLHKALELAGHPKSDKNGPETSEENYGHQHWHLALLELLRGDLPSGFDHYRARFGKEGWHRRKPDLPLWRGEDLKGKHILVISEQGLGDVLMLYRYCALLKAKGAKITFIAPPSLIPLLVLDNMADILRVGDPLSYKEYDFQTTIFDLPYRFKTTLGSIPAKVPYLPLPQVKDELRLSSRKKLKVGVVWAGGKTYGNDRRRSVSLPSFAKLFEEKDVDFYSLMRELKAGEKELLSKYLVTDLSEKLDDFLITAQFVNQLDLIITCDTSVAHLAAGMGKKVWILIPFAPDWRWLMAREDSPWYPTAKLFRQKKKADWHEVLERVQIELHDFIAR